MVQSKKKCGRVHSMGKLGEKNSMVQYVVGLTTFFWSGHDVNNSSVRTLFTLTVVANGKIKKGGVMDCIIILSEGYKRGIVGLK